jgi:coenzyme F420-reducing hydrogenase alpha subunit
MTDEKRERKTIKVDYLARVEGEGAMHVEIVDDRVEDVQLRIFEPPRYFEALLRGRDFSEAPDITARICGICPVAYQMSAVHAMERACGVTVDGQLRALRRLLYCGEWIASHTLHVYMLHAPDFLGYAGAVEMARDHGDIVKRGLKLKKAGNSIMAFLGGREIHPINVKVGGFYRTPTAAEMTELREQVAEALELARETVRWVATFDFPHLERDYEFVSLRHPDEYPFNEGRIVSSTGLDIDPSEWDDHFEEEHVERSNALHAIHKGHGAYFVGPMARYNLAREMLSDDALALAEEVGLEEECRNPFRSIIVRALEVAWACEEALQIIDGYERPDAPAVEVEPRAATGWAATEAPRGLLYHRYEIDQEGDILDADIVPPTSQNQKTIEDDLWDFVDAHMRLSDDELTWHAEQTIRNYDPCISCATHFLNLQVERR